MKKNKLYSLLFGAAAVVLISDAVFAASVQHSFADPVIEPALLREFSTEVAEFDQSTESKSVVSQFQSEWKQFLSSGSLNEAWLQNYSWSKELQTYFKPTPDAGQCASASETTPDTVESLPVSQIDSISKTAHSIADPVEYARQRIGADIVKAMLENHIKLVIYGGDARSLPCALQIAGNQVHALPSPYEAWGIHKAFISGDQFPDHNARFVLLIPPSRQYVIHYAEMFKMLNVEIDRVSLNHSDQARHLVNIENQFKSLQLSAPVDIIVMGYYPVFKAILGTQAVLSKEISLDEGLTVQLLEQRRDDQKLSPIRYLLVKSDLAIWGESSVFVAKGSLVLNPKAILFMGSAGGLTPKATLYGVSVPSQFVLADNKVVATPNFVFESLKAMDYQMERVTLGTRHGVTQSPIEETLADVNAKVDANLDAVDVETDLVAQMLAEYNSTAKQPVLYGALNLITDKPNSAKYNWSREYSLTKMSPELKDDARRRVVSSALTAVSHAKEFNP